MVLNMRYFHIIMFFILSMTMPTTQSFANSPKLPEIVSAAVISGEIPAPFGWRDFCRKYPQECEIKQSEVKKIELTATLWRNLQEINDWANHGIDPVSDMDHWGVPESWDIPTDGKGDCEDFALLKRKALLQYGLPSSVLLMTVVYNRRHEGHAILTVATDHGDFILDNQNDAILGSEQSGYCFIERQSSRNPNIWVRLNDTSDDIIVSSRKNTSNKLSQ